MKFKNEVIRAERETSLFCAVIWNLLFQGRRYKLEGPKYAFRTRQMNQPFQARLFIKFNAHLAAGSDGSKLTA